MVCVFRNIVENIKPSQFGASLPGFSRFSVDHIFYMFVLTVGSEKLTPSTHSGVSRFAISADCDNIENSQEECISLLLFK